MGAENISMYEGLMGKVFFSLLSVTILPTLKFIFEKFVSRNTIKSKELDVIHPLLKKDVTDFNNGEKFALEQMLSIYLKMTISFNEAALLFKTKSPSEAFRLFNRIKPFLTFSKNDKYIFFSRRAVVYIPILRKEYQGYWPLVIRGFLMYFLLGMVGGVFLLISIDKFYDNQIVYGSVILVCATMIGGALEILKQYSAFINEYKNIKEGFKPIFKEKYDNRALKKRVENEQ